MCSPEHTNDESSVIGLLEVWKDAQRGRDGRYFLSFRSCLVLYSIDTRTSSHAQNPKQFCTGFDYVLVPEPVYIHISFAIHLRV